MVSTTLLVPNLLLVPNVVPNLVPTYGTFYSFSAVMLVCTPVIYFILPETKDMSLEMIENYFLPNRTRFYVDLLRFYSKMTILYKNSPKSSILLIFFCFKSVISMS